MATSTVNTKKEQTIIAPRENGLYERKGFERRGIRRELAAVSDLSLTDKHVEMADKTYVDPRTTHLPVGPSREGETGGSGVEMLVEDGPEWDTFRYTVGFDTLQEDIMANADNVRKQVLGCERVLDFFADASFLTGLNDEKGSQIEPGVFSWLKSAIPSERTFDCSASAYDTYRTNNTAENIVAYDAYKEISGEFLTENANWGLAVGRQDALAVLNRVGQGDYNRKRYWQRITESESNGSIEGQMLVPDEIQLSEAPNGLDPLTVDLTSELGIRVRLRR